MGSGSLAPPPTPHLSQTSSLLLRHSPHFPLPSCVSPGSPPPSATLHIVPNHFRICLTFLPPSTESTSIHTTSHHAALHIPAGLPFPSPSSVALPRVPQTLKRLPTPPTHSLALHITIPVAWCLPSPAFLVYHNLFPRPPKVTLKRASRALYNLSELHQYTRHYITPT